MSYKFQLSRDWNVTYNNLQSVLNNDIILFSRKIYDICTSPLESIEITPEWSVPSLTYVKQNLENYYNDLVNNILPESDKKILSKPQISITDTTNNICTLSATTSDINTYPDLQYVWKINDKEVKTYVPYISVPYSIFDPFEIHCKTISPAYGLESLWSTYKNIPPNILEPETTITYISPERLDYAGFHDIIIEVGDINHDILHIDSNNFIVSSITKLTDTRWKISGEFLGSLGDSLCTFYVVLLSPNSKLSLRKIYIPTRNTVTYSVRQPELIISDQSIASFLIPYIPSIDKNLYKVYAKNDDNGTIYPLDKELERFVIPIDDINDMISLYITDIDDNIVTQNQAVVISKTLNTPYITSTILKNDGIFGELQLYFDKSDIPFSIDLHTQTNTKLTSFVYDSQQELISLYIDTSGIENLPLLENNVNITVKYKNLYNIGSMHKNIPIQFYNVLNFSLTKFLQGHYLKIQNSYDPDFFISFYNYNAYINYNKNLVISFGFGDEIEYGVRCKDNNILFTKETIYNFYKDYIYYNKSLYILDIVYNVLSNNVYYLNKEDSGNININIISAEEGRLANIKTMTINLAFNENYRLVDEPLSLILLKQNGFDIHVIDIDNQAIYEPITFTSPYSENIIDFINFVAIDEVGRLYYPNIGDGTIDIYELNIPIQYIQNKDGIYRKIMFSINDNTKLAIDFINKIVYKIEYNPIYLSVNMFREPTGITLIIQDDSRIYTMDCKEGTYMISGNTHLTITPILLPSPINIPITSSINSEPISVSNDRYMFREFKDLTMFKF